MYVLVTYDVSTVTPQGRKRLRQVARICCDHGQRVQQSVFEMKVDPAQWAACAAKLIDAYDPAEDSLRFYFLGADLRRRVEHHGVNRGFDIDGPLIV